MTSPLTLFLDQKDILAQTLFEIMVATKLFIFIFIKISLAEYLPHEHVQNSIQFYSKRKLVGPTGHF